MWNLLYIKLMAIFFSIIIFSVGWGNCKLSHDHNSLIFHFKKARRKISRTMAGNWASWAKFTI